MAGTTREWTYDALVAEGLDPRRYEIAAGEPREVPDMSRAGARILTRLGYLLERHLEAHGPIGHLYTAERFLLREQPRTERIPDLSYVSPERRPADQPYPSPASPDLAIEVRSPRDSVTELKQKLTGEYFPAGTREAWIVDPDLQTITVLRPGEPIRSFDRTGVLATDALPGLEVALDELFRVLD